MPKNISPNLAHQFAELQKKLVPLWEVISQSSVGEMEMNIPNTVVVIPSLTADVKIDIASQQAYEERMLFMLFLLRQPHLRMIFTSSMPVNPAIVDYYLHLIPSITPSHARKRLFFISPQDAYPQPLTNKLLSRPRLIQEIRSLIPDMERAHMVPFNTTDLERELAVKLGIPMYAADPRFFAFGTKSGCRKIFAEENIPHPLGAENLKNSKDLVEAIREMRQAKPTIQKAIVKLNEGVSGFGNAQLNLSDLPKPGDPAENEALEKRLKTLRFELPDLTYESYMTRLEKQGGIVEELVSGDEILSPSVQMRISPLGEVDLLSTHDQMLGGPSGQIYLGASFPANPEYGLLILQEAAKIGKRFAAEGVIGRFAVDFIVVRNSDGRWVPYAIEINLRKGGTTHPFLTLQFLTGGSFDTGTGTFRAKNGQQKFYVASDNIKSAAYRVFTVEDLLDLVSEKDLHFNHTSHTGVVMHMLCGVPANGRVGVTAIGNTPQQAEELYKRFTVELDEAAKRIRDF